jgi:deazaflavin-dependent oxidoreductase (nitroreductase family)
MARDDFSHALETTNEIEITVTGRKSRRPHTNPVWFVRKGNTLYLVPVRGRDSDWYKNVLDTPTVRLTAEGRQLTAETHPVKDAAKVKEVVEALRAKYGRDDVKKYYAKLDTAVEVPLA